MTAPTTTESTTEKLVTTPQIVVRFALYFSVLGLCLFGSAGTVRWVEAWIFLIGQCCVAVCLVVWLKKNDPALLRERLTYVKKDSKTWDKNIVRIFVLLSIPLYMLPGIDAVRFHWSHVPVPVQCIAFLGSAFGMTMYILAARANTFLTPIVEIQHRRGHRVVSAGPYAYVRHPMYLGLFFHVVCLPIFLGSYWTLLASAAVDALLIVRTYIEDRTLRRELEGYEEYAQRVRYRIFPGVW